MIVNVIRRCYSSSNGGGSFRPSACQMPSMLDIGSRRIFDSDNDTFRTSVRRFYKDEVIPAYPSWEEAGKPSREIWKKYGEQGFLGVSIPTEKGGLVGGSFIDEAIVMEEMAYANLSAPAIPVHGAIVMPYIANYGTQEQKEKYLNPMFSGEHVGAIAMTEPDAGSDLQGIKTYAKKDGDDYILNGSKTYITNGILADTVIVVAVTEGKDSKGKGKAHGISLFIVEEGMSGFQKGKNLKKLGCKSQDTAELFFEDVRLSKKHLLGGENKGFYLLMTELPQERAAIGIIAAAHCEWMFEETRDYIKQRKAFGKTLSNLQTIQHKMAQLKTEIACLRSFTDECIELHEQKKLCNEMASMLKYWGSDLENRVAGECLQLHGGYGFMWESSIAKAYADARIQTIYGGANEIMKELIARNIVKK